MNNKNIIRNRTNKLGVIAVVIVATVMIAITPAMVVSVQAGEAGDDAVKAIKEAFAYACSKGGPSSLSCANQMPRGDSDRDSAENNRVMGYGLENNDDDKSNQGECGVNMSCEDASLTIIDGDDCIVYDDETQTSNECD